MGRNANRRLENTTIRFRSRDGAAHVAVIQLPECQQLKSNSGILVGEGVPAEPSVTLQISAFRKVTAPKEQKCRPFGAKAGFENTP
jgi:hypothetical protein